MLSNLLFSKIKFLTGISIIAGLLLSILAGLTFAQMPTQTCEACGMMVDSTSQAHFKVVDSTSGIHYVECFKCAIKLLKTYGELNITTTCDWNGPIKTITVYLKDKVNTTIVNPASALFIDGSCAKNRIVYDQAASTALFANNGTSVYLAAIQNVTIPANATVMTVDKAAALYAFTSSPPPTPTPTPTEQPTTSPTPTTTPTSTPFATPTVSPTPTRTSEPAKTATPTPFSTNIATQTCEVCGMDVPADAQAKYMVTDGSGTVHYVECFMCALNVLKNYGEVNITTYCDWYGPNCLITVVSSQYGKVVTVNPSTALFLNGENCIVNRVAYNQTAADMLLANGFSKYTLPEQHYDLPANTQVSAVNQAAMIYSEHATVNSNGISIPLLLGAIGGTILIVLLAAVYYKFNYKEKH